MMPPPSHLTDWITPDTDKTNDYNFSGTVKCPCGNEHVEVSHPGGTYEEDGVKFPCTFEIAGKFFFLINVKCSACNEETVLFDADFHGWEGYVCHNKKQAALPRPELHLWNCVSCNSTSHQVRLSIQTEGKEDFMIESEGKFPEERWVDAFGWIDIDLTCDECGKETKGWVSYETM